MSLSAAVPSHRVQLAKSLLEVQAAMSVVMAVEAALVALGTGNSAGMLPAAGSLGWGALLLLAGRRLSRGRGLHLVTWLEISALVWASINLALAAFLVGTSTGPVAIVTGFLLPASVLLLSRSPK